MARLKPADAVLPAAGLFGILPVLENAEAVAGTFLQHERPHAAHVPFDDPLNRDFAQRDPNGFLDQFEGQPVALDEIQYVQEILQHIKIRIDRQRTPGLWVMTGSQQFRLMKNIRETLAGRIAILELFPFSLAEIGDRRLKLEQVLWTGLFPDPACHPQKRDLWLKSYIQTYLERDVRQLEAVRNFRAFEMFVKLLRLALLVLMLHLR